MKTDVANRFIWYKGQIINVNDAKSECIITNFSVWV